MFKVEMMWRQGGGEYDGRWMWGQVRWNQGKVEMNCGEGEVRRGQDKEEGMH